MSWNFSIKAVAAVDFEKAAWVALEEARPAIKQYNPEGDDQAVQAVHAVTKIVATGVVGRGLVSATLSGHGNPEHKPRSGYANDMISITVQCAEPYPNAG